MVDYQIEQPPRTKSFPRVNLRERNTCGVCCWYCDVKGAVGRRVNRVTFFCDDCGLEKARAVSDLEPVDLRALQRNSIRHASENIGAWLDKLGKSDLAQMTEDEWLGFLARVVSEYRNSMKILTDAPF